MSTVLVVHQSTFIMLYVATPEMRADPRNTKHQCILNPSLTQNKSGIAALIAENEFILCYGRAQQQDDLLWMSSGQLMMWLRSLSDLHMFLGLLVMVVYRWISCQTCIRELVRSWMIYNARCWWQMHQYVMSQRSLIGFRSAECLGQCVAYSKCLQHSGTADPQ